MGIVSFLLLLLVNLCSCDINKDRAECAYCANQLVRLATCLPYVGGEAKAPTPDCCIGLKQVLKDSKKCLCILVKDRNDPSLGLKDNATLLLASLRHVMYLQKTMLLNALVNLIILLFSLYYRYCFFYISTCFVNFPFEVFV
ncbi:Protein YLS3 [Bienertia sinuspersici]